VSFTDGQRDELRSFVWRCKNCSLVAAHGRPIMRPTACDQCEAVEFEAVGPVEPPQGPLPDDRLPAWERSG